MNNKTSGQIGLASVLSIAGAVLVAIIGGYFSQASRTDSRLEIVQNEQKANNLELVQRIAITETDVSSMKEDLKEIKIDVKSLLKLLK